MKLFASLLFVTLSCVIPITAANLIAEDASPQARVDGQALISAAASTRDVIEELAAKYAKESNHTVKLNLGSSNSLATQIIAGAPADLFLSANQEWAAAVSKAKLASEQVKLLTNKLVLVVPKGNPAGVKGPEDLVNPQVKKIALAGEKVPAGKYADQSLAKLGLLETLVAAKKIVRGQDVRTALAYVARGEAEAGIVYSTDLLAAKDVEQVHTFDAALHDEITYVLVLLKRGARNPAANGFFEYLKSDGANEIYQKCGFERISGEARQSKKRK